MKNHEIRSGERGFTLIELLVVVAIFAIVSMLGLPYLSKQIQRSKLVGVANQAAGTLRLARMDAIKGSRCAMVMIVPAEGAVRAFSDRDGDCRPGAGDIQMGEVLLPANVTFEAPGGAADHASIKGFTGWSGTSLAVFRSDGSALSTGAFRFRAIPIGSAGANYLEVNLAPAATARIEVRKWRGGDGGDPNDETQWHANGEGGSWQWN